MNKGLLVYRKRMGLRGCSHIILLRDDHLRVGGRHVRVVLLLSLVELSFNLCFGELNCVLVLLAGLSRALELGCELIVLLRASVMVIEILRRQEFFLL